MNAGGEELNLYRNTGSSTTIITPARYRESMGKVVAAKHYLRATGSAGYMDTKGMFKTTLTTASGASTRTWVYVVTGQSASFSTSQLSHVAGIRTQDHSGDRPAP